MKRNTGSSRRSGLSEGSGSGRGGKEACGGELHGRQVFFDDGFGKCLAAAVVVDTTFDVLPKIPADPFPRDFKEGES